MNTIYNGCIEYFVHDQWLNKTLHVCAKTSSPGRESIDNPVLLEDCSFPLRYGLYQYFLFFAEFLSVHHSAALFLVLSSLHLLVFAIRRKTARNFDLYTLGLN